MIGLTNIAASIAKRSKQTVSELKRLSILAQQEDEDPFMEKGDEVSTAYLHARPNFMQTRTLTPAEIGTAMHTIMQHIDFQIEQNAETVGAINNNVTNAPIINARRSKRCKCQSGHSVFQVRYGNKGKTVSKNFRELPFTYAHDGGDGDYQIIQGIADCLLQEENGWVLLDYKTDRDSRTHSIPKMKLKMKCKIATVFS